MSEDEKGEKVLLGDVLAPGSDWMSRPPPVPEPKSFKDVEAWIMSVSAAHGIDVRDALAEFRAAKTPMAKLVRIMFAAEFPLKGPAFLKRQLLFDAYEGAKAKGLQGDELDQSVRSHLAAQGIHYEAGSIRTNYHREKKRRSGDL